MRVAFNSTGSEFHDVGPETAKLHGPNEMSVFEEQQDFRMKV